jgi:hypothetical protein
MCVQILYDERLFIKIYMLKLFVKKLSDGAVPQRCLSCSLQQQLAYVTLLPT